MRDETIYIGRRDTSLTILPPDIVDLETNYLRFPIELRAENLRADATMALAGWGGWLPGFIGYLDDLASEWRGWDGAKVWSDDSGAVTLSATHNQMSEIRLSVSLRPFYGNDESGTWELEVVVPAEAGRMGDVAGAARSMIGGAGVPLTEH